jgi:hypothetical protein
LSYDEERMTEANKISPPSGDEPLESFSPATKLAMTKFADALLPRANALNAIIAQTISTRYTDMVKSIVAQLPTVNASQLYVPTLKIDYSTLFPGFSTEKLLKPAFDAIHAIQREQFAGLLDGIQVALDRFLPPNWRGVEGRKFKDLETMLLDEGLPLAWVPPPAVLARIFAASTPAERRRVIGRSWKTIACACDEQLDSISASELKGHAKLGKQAVASLLDGNSPASQALSANLLDSVLHAHFNKKDRRTITGQKTRLDFKSYPVRVAIVLGGIWGAYGEYWPEKGDKIPRSFSRHASAHGASARQYSRINAVLALMHVTALLKMLEQDFDRV